MDALWLSTKHYYTMSLRRIFIYRQTTAAQNCWWKRKNREQATSLKGMSERKKAVCIAIESLRVTYINFWCERPLSLEQELMRNKKQQPLRAQIKVCCYIRELAKSWCGFAYKSGRWSLCNLNRINITIIISSSSSNSSSSSSSNDQSSFLFGELQWMHKLIFPPLRI